MDSLNQFFHLSDIFKALLALASGLILGYEREMKDKSAGLKTISIISVGSALFALLSQNFSGDGDNFAIAAGIISGIGFLGAGVIFKEGFSIYGLTTAGIIWVSAAIGMAIGFGEFYIAATFLGSTLLIIYGIQFFGKYFVPKYNTRNLLIEVKKEFIPKRKELYDDIKQFINYQSISRTEKLENENIKIQIDIHISNDKMRELENFLLKNPAVVTFVL